MKYFESESVFFICIASVIITIALCVYSYNVSFITNGYSENVIVTPAGQYHRVWQKKCGR